MIAEFYQCQRRWAIEETKPDMHFPYFGMLIKSICRVGIKWGGENSGTREEKKRRLRRNMVIIVVISFRRPTVSVCRHLTDHTFNGETCLCIQANVYKQQNGYIRPQRSEE